MIGQERRSLSFHLSDCGSGLPVCGQSACVYVCVCMCVQVQVQVQDGEGYLRPPSRGSYSPTCFGFLCIVGAIVVEFGEAGV